MPNKEKSYSDKLQEFEKLVEWFESSDVDLAEAVDKFEDAAKLATELKQHLEKVENRVSKIKENFDK